VSWFKSRKAPIQRLEIIPAKPEPTEFEVTETHYKIICDGGQEYTVRADTIREGHRTTRFLQTMSYTWALSGFSARSTVAPWGQTPSYRVLLEVRNESIISIAYLGESKRTVKCT
jgi:hypothetical protein